MFTIFYDRTQLKAVTKASTTGQTLIGYRLPVIFWLTERQLREHPMSVIGRLLGKFKSENDPQPPDNIPNPRMQRKGDIE